MQRNNIKKLPIKVKKGIVSIFSPVLYFVGAALASGILFFAILALISGISQIFHSETPVLYDPDFYYRKIYSMVVSEDLKISIDKANSDEGGRSIEYKRPYFFETEKEQSAYSEDELLEISRNLMVELFDNPVDSWQIKDVKYHLYDCEKGFSGYVHASYGIENPVNEGEYYLVEGHHLDIMPASEYAVDSYPYAYYLFEMKNNYYYDQTMDIDATRALEIAEAHGGTSVRSQEENRYCEAIIALDENNQNKWHIWYTGKHGVIFEGEVDRRTGWFKRIRGKKLLYYLLENIGW